jgi:hypothetical protein
MTPYRQLPLFEEPAAGTVVKDGAGRRTVGPDGKVSTRRGTSFTWLRCDVCGCGRWVKGLAPDQARLDDEDYRKSHGAHCTTGPRGCPGRHVVAVER